MADCEDRPGPLGMGHHVALKFKLMSSFIHVLACQLVLQDVNCGSSLTFTLYAGKKKKGKHGKSKPAPAEDDDIDAILAEIGEGPAEAAAPSQAAETQGKLAITIPTLGPIIAS